MKDMVAIVGIGTTEYGRALQRTPLSLGLEAATKAIRDAGIDKQDVDGICGGGLRPDWRRDTNYLALQEGLGIHSSTWVMQSWLGCPLVHAAHAIFSGACNVALIVQSYQRDAGTSSSASGDPFRARASEGSGGLHAVRWDYAQRWFHALEPYGAWAARYMYEYGAPREVFGLIAINNRTNAVQNQAAVLRSPITMDDYLSARMIREPLGLLDMDLPVDCAEAIVITTAERAKELPNKPVYIHATTLGQSEHGVERYESGRHWTQVAPWFAMKALWSKADFEVGDMDLFFPYDGVTTIAVNSTEAAGFCKPGDAWGYFQQHWDQRENRLKLNGRTLVCTNGGNLSHGRAGGFNFYTESVRQLRGDAGVRQLPNAKTSLVGIGSFYHEYAATILRVD